MQYLARSLRRSRKLTGTFRSSLETAQLYLDRLLKHGEKVLEPQRRPGNLLLLHKISTVRSAIPNMSLD